MLRLVRPVALIVVAAVAGFLIARSAGSSHHAADALTHTAQAATFSVHYPDDWTRGAPVAVSGLALDGALGLHPSASATRRLAIGTTHAATVGTLPASFLASLPRRPRPQAETVSLGGIDYDRYLDLRPRGAPGVVSVYLLATTRATIVATCAAPRPDGTFTAQCERVLQTLRLAPGIKISGGVDAAYALELNQILATLNQARKANGPGLLAPSLETRARAAERLAAAETGASRAAGRLSAGSATAANHSLSTALASAASGYRSLATAARAHDRSGYEAAQRTLRQAKTTLARAFRELSRLGYQLR
jgi:hypothetical protein